MASAQKKGSFNIFKKLTKKKVKNKLPPPHLVIAIDVGTFSCGYTLQWRSDYDKDPLRSTTPVWMANVMRTDKTSTALLLGPDKSFKAFGYEAESRFDRLKAEGEDPEKWYFCRHFKMMLYHHKDVTDETPVEAANDKHLPVIEAFSNSIKYLKDQALEYLTQNAGNAIDLSEIKWIVTVPTIWDDQIKQVMRRAAERAGIPPDRLCMAIEPECAALYCSQLPLTQLVAHSSSGNTGFANIPGYTVTVVDMGGGTVDITTLRMLQKGTMEYVFKSGGGPWGGTNVNERFQLMLKDIVGDDVMDEFATNNRRDLHELMMEFEVKKRGIKHPSAEDSSAPFEIKLPSTLIKLWEERSETDVSTFLRSERKLGQASFEGDRLLFNPDLIRDIIQQTVKEIVRYVRQELNKPEINGKSIDLLVLVGGFAESEFVVTSIRDELSVLDIPVGRPQKPELAIMRGAVLYGHNEQVIVSRKLQYTYGIGMIMEFKEGTHDPSKKFEADGKEWARDVFRKHATVGQEVHIGQWMPAKTYYPTDGEQQSAQVYVFISESENPVHTTEQGCKCIGMIDIQLSNDGDRQSQKSKLLLVSMNLWGVEVEVRVTNKNLGETITRSLKPC